MKINKEEPKNSTLTISKLKSMVNKQSMINVLLDIIRTIQDPEKPMTLEDLEVVNEDLISVTCKHYSKYKTFIFRGSSEQSSYHLDSLGPHRARLSLGHDDRVVYTDQTL